ncbi:MAG: ATP-binding protein [Chlamydiia bacterium]|nr:ATP-binding protein [Chlamydiia bacterium]
MPHKNHYKRLLDIPSEGDQSIFLFGPRGTGKTTWLCDHLVDAIYIDLLSDRVFRNLVTNPSSLENLIPPKHSQWIVIDEIQKIPPLLNEVHRLIEWKGLRFILTGSSARALRRKGVNLLAGRALTFNMHPMLAQELGKDFKMSDALRYGMLPSVYQGVDPKHYLKAYVGTYLREEVMQEGITRSVGEFARFLETASFSQGEVINFSEISREVGIERRTVQSYFSILEDMLLGHRLPVFSKRAKRKLISHEKFYYFDVGVYNELRPKGPLDSIDEIEGAALETLFFQHLRALNDYFQLGYSLYFWRTSDQLEVDFIAYGEKGLVAFEVKRARKLSSGDLKGLRAFKQDYPMAKAYVLFGGEQREFYGDVTAIPFHEALLGLKELLSPPSTVTEQDH